MKRYLYFGEPTVETTGEACMFAVDDFLGMTPVNAVRTMMHFKSRNGAATDDTAQLFHVGTTTKAFMTEIVKFMQADQKNPFLVIGDRSGIRVTNMMTAAPQVTTEA